MLCALAFLYPAKWLWLLGGDFHLAVVLSGLLVPFVYYRKFRRYQKATLREELVQVYGFDVRSLPLATLSISDGPGLLDKDAVLVAGDAETLRLYGDELPYTLPKANIRAVSYRRFPLPPWPMVEIVWVSDEGVHTLVLTPKGPISPWHANRIVDSIRLAIEYGRPGLPPPTRYFPPTSDRAPNG